MSSVWTLLALLGLSCVYELEARASCQRICGEIYRPVCGSDGKTYSNYCLFLTARCKNSRLRIVSNGPCKRACERPCPKNLKPVCGSDGKTYDNDCLFAIARCKNSRLRKVSNGPCRRACERRCTKIFKPVCGSDGKTYNNDCLFAIARCKNSRLRKVSNGPCRRACERHCPKIFKPVCGSDGKTYNNDCLFAIARCKNSRLRKVSNGPCRKVVKPGRCPKPAVCKYSSCRNMQKRDLCQKDGHCRGFLKCCAQMNGKRCTRPCPLIKCRPCRKGYKFTTSSNGCPSCRCVCIQFRCFINPCHFAKCPGEKSARCRPNYCGGCNAEFYVGRRKANCGLPGKGK